MFQVSEETIAEARFWRNELARKRVEEEEEVKIEIPGPLRKRLEKALKALQEIINLMEKEEGN